MTLTLFSSSSSIFSFRSLIPVLLLFENRIFDPVLLKPSPSSCLRKKRGREKKKEEIELGSSAGSQNNLLLSHSPQLFPWHPQPLEGPLG